MVSEDQHWQTFDQLSKCYKVSRHFGTSDEDTPISKSLEFEPEIAQVEKDSLHFGTSKLVYD